MERQAIVMIGFRVDANEQIATGHLVRCISIATELIKRGKKCIFFLAEEKETARLEAVGIPYVILHTDWRHMESEYDIFLPLLKKYPLKWLVVDSYQITTSYLATLNQQIPVLYLDDMETDTYPVSAVLHYGLRSDYDAYFKRYLNTDTKVLAGTKYSPLREEFQAPSAPVIREKSILITTGGTDPYHVTLQILSACLDHDKQTIAVPDSLNGFSFDVIVGSMNQDEPQLQAMAARFPQIRLHKNVNNMSYYMRRNQLAVSAGGTTLDELCACSTPTVCFSFADNQLAGVKQMGSQHIMLHAGDARFDPVVSNILQALNVYLTNDDLRKEYAARMNALVDGQGVQRIAEFLEHL